MMHLINLAHQGAKESVKDSVKDSARSYAVLALFKVFGKLLELHYFYFLSLFV